MTRASSSAVVLCGNRKLETRMVGPFVRAASMPISPPSGEDVVQVLGGEVGMLAMQVAGGRVTWADARQRRPLGVTNRHREWAAIREPARRVTLLGPLHVGLRGQPVARQADLRNRSDQQLRVRMR